MDFVWNVIHREQDTERTKYIEALEENLGFLLHRVEGLNGQTLLDSGFPQKHPHEQTPTTPGNIGCTATHVIILDMFLKSPDEYVAIFEDDAVMGENILEWFASMRGATPWDILFFGVNEIVDGEALSSGLSLVRRFWGTHAVVVNRVAAEAIVKTYKKSIHDGYALPADWLYSWAIRDYKVKAICPTPSLATQARGIVSVTTGKIRH